jgi:hypothetical protein
MRTAERLAEMLINPIFNNMMWSETKEEKRKEALARAVKLIKADRAQVLQESSEPVKVVTISSKEALNWPKIGDEIYIPSAAYIDHGADDRRGGLTTVKQVYVRNDIAFVSVKEVPGIFNYKHLLEQQDKLKLQYGTERARPDPDLG